MAKAKILLIIILFSIVADSFSQQTDKSWDQWIWITGDWIGEGTGNPSQGNGKFSFKLDLDRNILVRKSSTAFPASADKTAFVHEDLMIIYRDQTGTPNKAIYFDNENHVINYTITVSEKSIILVSEKISNVPVFRLTYTSLDAESVDVRFEMSQDGENFMTYIEGISKRINQTSQDSL